MSDVFHAKFPVHALVARKKNTNEIDRFFGMAITDPTIPNRLCGCMVLFSTAEKGAEFCRENSSLVSQHDWAHLIESKAELLSAAEFMQRLKYSRIVIDPPLETNVPFVEFAIDDLITQLRDE